MYLPRQLYYTMGTMKTFAPMSWKLAHAQQSTQGVLLRPGRWFHGFPQSGLQRVMDKQHDDV